MPGRRLSLAMLALCALPFATAAQAQTASSDRVDRWLDNCHNEHWNDDDVRACDTRTLTLPATSHLDIDGRENGSVTVHGWDSPGIKVVAMVETHARSTTDAESLAKDVKVETDDGSIRAEGPRRYGDHQDWAVSYEVWVPRATDLQVEARNGGISVDGTNSRADLETVNGTIHLASVSGDVTGHTTNGAVSADLDGKTWNGHGLDLRTTNGTVRLDVPSDYSADLETGTVNGGFNIDFPITVQGRISRDLSTKLGTGGPMIRAMTTNGGVSIRRK